MDNSDDVKVVAYHGAGNSAFARLDAAAKSDEAVALFPDFFNSPDHVKKVEAVKAIVDKFFTEKRAIYVNSRVGKTYPFSVVKVERPMFPNNLTDKQKKERYYDPLKSHGVEIIYSKNTNSYLYHIK